MEPIQILFYQTPAGESSVEVYFEDETFWLSQKKMGELFGVETHTINYHLKEIFRTGELDEDSVIRNFRITAADLKNPGKMQKKVADALAKKEYEKFRILQDRKFESDFDKEVKKLKKGKEI